MQGRFSCQVWKCAPAAVVKEHGCCQGKVYADIQENEKRLAAISFWAESKGMGRHGIVNTRYVCQEDPGMEDAPCCFNVVESARLNQASL